jgi:hypothetical protein
MADALTRRQIALLKELNAAGEHGRILRLRLISRDEVAHLIDTQYIKRLRHSQHFVITERGREALVTTEDR